MTDALASGPAPNVVMFFAHPDDEFAVFPWIERLRHAGGRVVCLWLTDGGWGGQDPLRRTRESTGVLGPMGVGHNDMKFAGVEWKIPDGELHLRMQAVESNLSALVPRLGGFSEVWMPAWEGGHQDHDATHLLALRFAVAIGAQPLQFSLYQGAGLPGPWFRVLSPLESNGPRRTLITTAAERWRCVRRCLRYRSQLKSFLGLLPFYVVRLLSSRAFVLQPVVASATATRPHPGPLLYERRGGPSWDAFADATSDFRA